MGRGSNGCLWRLIAAGVLALLLGIGISWSVFHVFSRGNRRPDDATPMRNTRLALARSLVENDPNLHVKTDELSLTLTVTNVQTGEVTVQRFPREEDHSAGPNPPGWVPEYPGATRELTCTRHKTDPRGGSEGATYLLSTTHPVAQVVSFYEEKAKSLGMKVKPPAAGERPLTLRAEGKQRSFSVAFDSGDAGRTALHLTYEERR